MLPIAPISPPGLVSAINRGDRGLIHGRASCAAAASPLSLIGVGERWYIGGLGDSNDAPDDNQALSSKCSSGV